MERIGLSNEELEQLRQIDIRTVEPDTLTDIRDIKIDNNLTKKERMAEFLKQIKNPYCFKVGKIVVGVSFSDEGVELEQCLEHYLEMLSL